MTPNAKTCKTCGEVKPLDEFQGVRRPDGSIKRHAHCLPCRRRSRRKQAHERFDYGFALLAHCAEDENGCWIWQGTVTHDGYGYARACGLMIRAHRLSYALHHGDLPADAIICHTCDVPLCVNPDHLYAGDEVTNWLDMVERKRRKRIRGEERICTRLTPELVREARRRAALGETQRSIAKDFGVAQSAISRAVRGETWAHVA